MNWKQPFELAFELGLWSLGWVLVALIGFVVLAIFYAVVKTISEVVRKKPKVKESKNLFKVVRND
jgi:uncharacterized BrkB/YihY/UPF0761 family membrane protein